MKKLSLWGSLASIVGLGFTLYPMFTQTETAGPNADTRYHGKGPDNGSNTGTVVNNQTEQQTGNNSTVIIHQVQGDVNLRPGADVSNNRSDSGQEEQHPASINNEQTVSVMIRDKVKLRQGSSISSALLCVLWPSDRVIPLNSVFSENKVQWCQVGVVSSKNCVMESKGYVPSVALPGNCTVR